MCSNRVKKKCSVYMYICIKKSVVGVVKDNWRVMAKKVEV